MGDRSELNEVFTRMSASRIDDLLFDAAAHLDFREVETDGLREKDALIESGLLSVRVDAVTGVAGLLFDCRNALQIREGNTAVLVVGGLSRVDWVPVHRGRSWPRVDLWNPRDDARGFHVDAAGSSLESLVVEGATAHFFIGDVPGMDVAPPDLTSAPDEEVRSGFASWASEFRVVSAARPILGQRRFG